MPTRSNCRIVVCRSLRCASFRQLGAQRVWATKRRRQATSKYSSHLVTLPVVGVKWLRHKQLLQEVVQRAGVGETVGVLVGFYGVSVVWLPWYGRTDEGRRDLVITAEGRLRPSVLVTPKAFPNCTALVRYCYCSWHVGGRKYDGILRRAHYVGFRCPGDRKVNAIALQRSILKHQRETGSACFKAQLKPQCNRLQ